MRPISSVLTDCRSGYWGGEAGTGQADVRVIRNGDISATGSIKWSGLPSRGFAREEAARSHVAVGDLVLTTSGNCGQVAIVDREPQVPTCASNFLRILRVDRTLIDPKYLFHYMNQRRFVAQLRPFIRGSTLQNLSVNDALSAVDVPLPPIEEQRRIAEILDRADALRTKRREALAHLDALTQSIFLDMFGDSATSGALGEGVSDFHYGTSTKSGTEGYPVLRIPNIVGGAIETKDLKFVSVATGEFSRLRLREGDLLFVRTNGNANNVGRCAVFSKLAVAPSGFQPDEFVYASYLIRARVNPAYFDPTFVSYYFRTPRGRRELRSNCKTSAGQYNINIEGLGTTQIPLISLDRQRKFAAQVSDISNRTLLHRSSLLQSDRLFAALQQELLGDMR